MKNFGVNIIFVVIVGSVCFLLGAALSYVYASKVRLLDEYGYAFKVSRLIYANNKKDFGSVDKDLNNLLYFHVSKFLYYRDFVPEYFRKEEDEVFCMLFRGKSGKNEIIFKDVLTDEKLYEYIYKNTSFCGF